MKTSEALTMEDDFKDDKNPKTPRAHMHTASKQQKIDSSLCVSVALFFEFEDVLVFAPIMSEGLNSSCVAAFVWGSAVVIQSGSP
mmetsp:Transcript_16873/g.16299  ORF Transcript_16873/g.16299 Transcript_16873/m.16299 type:complete len:85 (-) Transcript_16873:71-325(-)